ncbi:hypothetical protein ACOMHN_016494 [Nucella lapillus]
MPRKVSITGGKSQFTVHHAAESVHHRWKEPVHSAPCRGKCPSQVERASSQCTMPRKVSITGGKSQFTVHHAAESVHHRWKEPVHSAPCRGKCPSQVERASSQCTMPRKVSITGGKSQFTVHHAAESVHHRWKEPVHSAPCRGKCPSQVERASSQCTMPRKVSITGGKSQFTVHHAAESVHHRWKEPVHSAPCRGKCPSQVERASSQCTMPRKVSITGGKSQFTVHHAAESVHHRWKEPVHSAPCRGKCPSQVERASSQCTMPRKVSITGGKSQFTVHHAAESVHHRWKEPVHSAPCRGKCPSQVERASSQCTMPRKVSITGGKSQFTVHHAAESVHHRWKEPVHSAPCRGKCPSQVERASSQCTMPRKVSITGGKSQFTVHHAAESVHHRWKEPVHSAPCRGKCPSQVERASSQCTMPRKVSITGGKRAEVQTERVEKASDKFLPLSGLSFYRPHRLLHAVGHS